MPSWYIILLLIGALLLGAEIFVPGGILGVFGVLALGGALVIGWGFPWPWNLVSSVGLIAAVAGSVVLWIRWFPKTAPGRRMMLQRSGRDFKLDHPETRRLIGREGRVVAPLRPSGIGIIDGRRYDVMTHGIWLDAGRRFRVVEVHGNRLVVEPIDAGDEQQGAPS